MALFNQDDPLTSALVAQEKSTASLIPFSPSHVRDIHVTWAGVQCTLPIPDTEPDGETLQLTSRLLGAHHVSTMLATYTVAQMCGLKPIEIQQAFRQITPLAGRLNPLPGIHDSMLLDDSHNAAPASVLAGLMTLKALPARRRIAILGDMLSLGDYEEEGHRLVGRQAVHCVDYLITRGERAALIAKSARTSGTIHQPDHCYFNS